MLVTLLRASVRFSLPRNRAVRVLAPRFYSDSNGNNFVRKFDLDNGDIHAIEDYLNPRSTRLLKKIDRKSKRSGTSVNNEGEFFVIQPVFRSKAHGDNRRIHRYQLEEAKGLVEAVTEWNVTGSYAIRLKRIDEATFFSPKAMKELSSVLNESAFTSVMVNCPMLTFTQQQNLQHHWGSRVLDRYSTVLHIFNERAHTREANLQIKLASLHYNRTRVVGAGGIIAKGLDQRRGGSFIGVGGGGKTQVESLREQLHTREKQMKAELEEIKIHREQHRCRRRKHNFPIVAVVGYTNAGKTSLIKALTGDVDLEPEDRLFATLDTTAHAGRLPNGMKALFVDTVGFVSDLPPNLVESFRTTLEDVLDADVLIHVRDISHPSTRTQCIDVLQVLRGLRAPPKLLNNMIEVLNKADQYVGGSSELCDSLAAVEAAMVNHRASRPGILPNPVKVISSSVTLGTGIPAIKEAVEELLMRNTDDRVQQTLQVPPSGDHISWLYREAAVSDCQMSEDSATMSMTVVISPGKLSQFAAKFPHIKVDPAFVQQKEHFGVY